MKIVNVFDAVREGDFKEFKSLYKGNINKINEYSQMNLLQTSLINTYNEAGRLKIIKFLIRKGIDVNYRDCKYQRNALHIFFFNFLHGNAVYLENVVNVLLNAGISVNAVDKYNAVPLKYAITVCRLKTEELRDVYNIMLKAGADCNLKDVFGKSCIDYAKELAWRTEFIRIVEEVQNTIMGKRIGFCGRSMEDL